MNIKEENCWGHTFFSWTFVLINLLVFWIIFECFLLKSLIGDMFLRNGLFLEDLNKYVFVFMYIYNTLLNSISSLIYYNVIALHQALSPFTSNTVPWSILTVSLHYDLPGTWPEVSYFGWSEMCASAESPKLIFHWYV